MYAPQLLRPLILAALIAHTAVAAAQTTAETDAAVTSVVTKKAEDFFDNLKAPIVNAEDAFQELLANGPLDDHPEQLKAFVESYKKLEAPHGRFLAAKRVHFKRVGDDLVFLTYLYETERFPLVWRFAFYRPPVESPTRPDWFVVRLSFDTKLEQLPNLP